MKKKTSNRTELRRKKKLMNTDFPEVVDESYEHVEDDHTNCIVTRGMSQAEDLFDNPEDEDIEEDEEEVVEKVKLITNKKKPDKEKFYVQPKEFDDEIMAYYKSGKMSDELALMVSKISHKLSYAPNFINYSYREEMVGDGIIRMMKALISKKYNHKKGTNPFSYFTRIAFNAFRNRIKKEKHMHETHEKYRRELMSMSENYNSLMKNNNIRIMKERDRLLE